MKLGLAPSVLTVRSVSGAVDVLRALIFGVVALRAILLSSIEFGTLGFGTVGFGTFGLVADARAQEFRCVQAQSAQEVKRLTEANAIISIDVFMPNVTVVVDDRAWNRRGMDEKKALAQNIDCAMAGPNNGMLRTVLFRSNKTNRELAEFSNNELTIQ